MCYRCVGIVDCGSSLVCIAIGSYGLFKANGCAEQMILMIMVTIIIIIIIMLQINASFSCLWFLF